MEATSFTTNNDQLIFWLSCGLMNNIVLNEDAKSMPLLQ